MASISKYENTAGKTLYRVRYRKPDHTNTDKRGFARKCDAEAFLNEIERAKRRGEYIDEADSRVLIEDLGEQWLASKQNAMKASSYHSLEVSWNTHVKPKWGNYRLSEIRHNDIQQWVNQLSSGSPDSTATGEGKKSDCGHSGGRYSTGDSTLGGARPPHTLKPGGRHHSAQEKGKGARLLIRRRTDESGRALRKSPNARSRPGALRPSLGGGTAGLRVEDVDFSHRTILVARSATMVGNRIIIDSPKNGKPRKIVWPAILEPGLKDSRHGQTAF